MEKNKASVGTEEVSLVPLSLFIKPDDNSNKFFRESIRFGKVNLNPPTDNPIVFEYLSGKIHCRVLSEIVYFCVVVGS